MRPPCTLVWLRNDLRVHDHPALCAAAEAGPVLPVAILPARLSGTSLHGLRRTGPFRAAFLRETLQELDRALTDLGAPLLIARGDPAAIVTWLVTAHAVNNVWYQDEPGTEEAAEVASVITALNHLDEPPTIHAHASQTLVHPDDLSFDATGMPRVFTAFRKAVEAAWMVRPTLPAPQRLAAPPTWPPSAPPAGLASVRLGLPEVADLAGSDAPSPDRRAVLRWRGGERAARSRLDQYFWERDGLRRYKETRNGLLHADDSSKLSPWLANGSLSPRLVYEEVRRYESERTRNQSTYWLIFELLWRDYFSLLARAVGRRLYLRDGPKGRPTGWRADRQAFARWQEGRTGHDFIDANLRELAATGFMSNRGRQVVASYLTRDMGVDWRLGAEHFEWLLLDYDPASNYGNWTYAVGVGTDPREDRYFHPDRQAERYDRGGRYRRRWLASK